MNSQTTNQQFEQDNKTIIMVPECVLPILTRTLNSVLLACSVPSSFLRPGNRHSCTSITPAICTAVGNVSLELCNEGEKYLGHDIKGQMESTLHTAVGLSVKAYVTISKIFMGNGLLQLSD